MSDRNNLLVPLPQQMSIYLTLISYFCITHILYDTFIQYRFFLFQFHHSHIMSKKTNISMSSFYADVILDIRLLVYICQNTFLWKMLAQTACKAALWKNVILKYIILWSLYVWSLMYTETFVQIIKFQQLSRIHEHDSMRFSHGHSAFTLFLSFFFLSSIKKKKIWTSLYIIDWQVINFIYLL